MDLRLWLTESFGIIHDDGVYESYIINKIKNKYKKDDILNSINYLLNKGLLNKNGKKLNKP